MSAFEFIESHGDHEQVVFCHNKEAGLKAIVAIHNTSLGPALGGLRMWNYRNEQEALVDVLRLSRGMTYKAAASGLNLGGGKAVIIGDPRTKTEEMFRAFGVFVNSLNGLYITAEDVGTTVQDMEYIFMETPHVVGIPEIFGGSGDPSSYTAHGVLMGLKAAVKEKLMANDLQGVRVAVQGTGQVGSHLVDFLIKEGAEVVVSDINNKAAQFLGDKYNLKIIDPEKILATECDVLAPCALGSVINDQSMDHLKCKIIAGAANNQLAEARHGQALFDKGILYAPDYVINAGGLMNVFVELEGYSSERAFEKTTQIYDNLQQVFEISRDKNMATNTAANALAEARIQKIGTLRRRPPTAARSLAQKDNYQRH